MNGILFTAIGLGVDFVGAVALAWDLLRPIDDPPYEDLASFVPELASATAKAFDGSPAALELLERRLYAAAMAETAERSALGRGVLRLRRLGRVGIVLMVLGFFLQFMGILMDPAW